MIENPWAGQGFVEDLAPGIDATASDLGALLAPQVLEALGAPAEAYGKAAIVGLDGEVEHGSGLIHTLKFGDHFRKAANATTLLPAVEKRGPAGVRLRHPAQAHHRRHHPLAPPDASRCGSPTPRTPTRSWSRSPPPPRAVPSSGWRRCPPSSEPGDDRDRRVVLLHGVGLDHTMWEPVARAAGRRLRRGRHPTCRATARVRRHPRASRWPTSPTDVAAEVPPGSHLVGFSLGALVAQHLARYRPELVATLTSVSSVCRRTAERARGRAGPAAQPPSATSPRAPRRRCSGGTTAPTSTRSWCAAREATLLANDRDSFLHCYRVFATADAEIGPELRPDHRSGARDHRRAATPAPRPR